jgi:hypothetical protein
MALATVVTRIANPARRPRRRKNESISQGFWRDGVFHPIRSADDYDPDAVGESRQYAKKKGRKKVATKAKKRKKNPTRRKLTAKQIAAGFGGKRRQSAVKSARKRKNRPHWLSKSAKARPSQRKRKKNAAMGYRGSTPKKKKAWTSGWKVRKKSNPKKSRRKNVGGIFALTNPARKGQSKMARPKKRKGQRKNPAGYYKKRKKMNRRGRRRNPGGTFGSPMDWLSLGAGAIGGGLGATSLPQLVLGSNNSGPVGYLAMAASTAILAVAAHMLFKRNIMLTSGVIAGGTGALIKRIIGDYTPLGQYLGTSGMGDYLTNFNFPVPQIIGGNGNTSLGTPGSIPVSVAGAGMSSMSLIGRPLY